MIKLKYVHGGLYNRLAEARAAKAKYFMKVPLWDVDQMPLTDKKYTTLGPGIYSRYCQGPDDISNDLEYKCRHILPHIQFEKSLVVYSWMRGVELPDDFVYPIHNHGEVEMILNVSGLMKMTMHNLDNDEIKTQILTENSFITYGAYMPHTAEVPRLYKGEPNEQFCIAVINDHLKIRQSKI